jgi:hypothetical protein
MSVGAKGGVGQQVEGVSVWSLEEGAEDVHVRHALFQGPHELVAPAPSGPER